MSNNSAAKVDGNMVDKISRLSDDVILSILSILTLKDATATCILSKRWRYVSTYLTCLNFVVSDELSLVSEFYKAEKSRYVNWVNQVVSLNRAPLINDFRICCPFLLDTNHVDSINRWVEFALKKRVKYLELEIRGLIDAENNSRYYIPNYSLPHGVFERSFGFNNYTTLTSLRLTGIDVSGELLELVISQCQLLEHLFVKCSYALKYLKVRNSSKRLKCLAIHYCNYLKELVVDADNLKSIDLRCHGGPPNVVYVSVPSLVEAHFGGEFCHTMFSQFKEVEAGFRHQLSKLSLSINRLDVELIIPCFQAVKHLHLEIWKNRDFHFDLHQLSCFLEACPAVEKVELNVSCLCSRCHQPDLDLDLDLDSDSDSDSDSQSNIEVDAGVYTSEDVKNWLEARENGFQVALPCLRVVEWLNAFTCSHTAHGDIEVMQALFIVKIAPMLERLIFGPWSDIYKKMELIKKAAREEARKLAKVIPSRVEVVIM